MFPEQTHMIVPKRLRRVMFWGNVVEQKTAYLFGSPVVSCTKNKPFDEISKTIPIYCDCYLVGGRSVKGCERALTLEQKKPGEHGSSVSLLKTRSSKVDMSDEMHSVFQLMYSPATMRLIIAHMFNIASSVDSWW